MDIYSIRTGYYAKIRSFRLPLSIVLGGVLLVLITLSEVGWEDYPAVEISLFALGCFLVGIASLGRLWCSLYIAGYKTDRLVMLGPYSLCRNPLYLFSFFGMAGCGFATETLVIPLILAVFFMGYYPAVIKQEENELRILHQAEFAAYVNSTPAFFPNFSLYKEPTEYLVNPKIFRKHIFDNLWFIWMVGIVEIIEGVKEIVGYHSGLILY
jgi:protein-S-isoprenylcysteine O-methyltransferase Ste14